MLIFLMETQSMNTKIIDELTERSLAGTITFPEQIKELIANNIERYSVDLAGLTKSAYDINGESYIHSFSFDPGTSAVAEHFDVQALKDAILDSQKGVTTYQRFLHRAMAAGCCFYEVFITGKKVIYFGRNGDLHTEYFPPQRAD